jgi:DNA repair/transcription protein MET18/MMS19
MGYLEPHRGMYGCYDAEKLPADLGQTLFDSVYNYFPITFRPPPNDPYGITSQDLKGRLQECISSTRHFAPHAFPALLDKLDSTSPNVKVTVSSAL